MRLAPLLLVALLVLVPADPGAAAPEGQMTWAIHISLAPTWFDPAETPGIATPFMVLYALHDALVKPMPGNPMAPSLAESWTVSKDGLVYEFVLRQGARFHNGEPVTAADVKFSFERYRGAASKLFPPHRHVGDELIFLVEGANADESGAVATGNMNYRPNGCVHTVTTQNGATVLAVVWGRTEPV